jgi:hypothetical protein
MGSRLGVGEGGFDSRAREYRTLGLAGVLRLHVSEVLLGELHGLGVGNTGKSDDHAVRVEEHFPVTLYDSLVYLAQSFFGT